MSGLNILADRNMHGVEAAFAGLGEVRLVDGRKLGSADLDNTDVLLVRSVTRVDAQFLAGSKVRFVGTATSGFDHVDRGYLADAGIGFSHAPGSNANSVVEYVLCAIAHIDDSLERLLAGATLGVIGAGIIGRALASRCRALGIDALVYDPWLEEDAVQGAAGLEEVLACPVISIHAELTHKLPWPSYHLLGAQELGSLSSATLLINAGRGEIVDNAALLALREAGRGPTVILDVWEGEPDISAPLLQHAALGTAHIAGYSADGKLLATQMLKEAVLAHYGLPLTSAPPPVEAAPALEIPPALLGAALIRWALQARYDIGGDDALLRAVTDPDDPRRSAAGFDQLRKAYDIRRELLNSPVLVGVGGSQRPVLEALGCRLGRGLN